MTKIAWLTCVGQQNDGIDDAEDVGVIPYENSANNEPVIDKSVDYRAFCLQTTTKRKIKIFAQWDK